jgi:hypothetical protein
MTNTTVLKTALFALTVLSASMSSYAADSHPANQSDVQQVISNANCKSSPEQFTSCLRALQVATLTSTDNQGNGFRIIPTGNLKYMPDQVAKTAQSFGYFSMVQNMETPFEQNERVTTLSQLSDPNFQTNSRRSDTKYLSDLFGAEKNLEAQSMTAAQKQAALKKFFPGATDTANSAQTKPFDVDFDKAVSALYKSASPASQDVVSTMLLNGYREAKWVSETEGAGDPAPGQVPKTSVINANTAALALSGMTGGNSPGCNDLPEKTVWSDNVTTNFAAIAAAGEQLQERPNTAQPLIPVADRPWLGTKVSLLLGEGDSYIAGCDGFLSKKTGCWNEPNADDSTHPKTHLQYNSGIDEVGLQVGPLEFSMDTPAIFAGRGRCTDDPHYGVPIKPGAYYCDFNNTQTVKEWQLRYVFKKSLGGGYEIQLPIGIVHYDSSTVFQGRWETYNPDAKQPASVAPCMIGGINFNPQTCSATEIASAINYSAGVRIVKYLDSNEHSAFYAELTCNGAMGPKKQAQPGLGAQQSLPGQCKGMAGMIFSH